MLLTPQTCFQTIQSFANTSHIFQTFQRFANNSKRFKALLTPRSCQSYAITSNSFQTFQRLANTSNIAQCCSHLQHVFERINALLTFQIFFKLVKALFTPRAYLSLLTPQPDQSFANRSNIFRTLHFTTIRISQSLS